jgi:hypothetical protein
MAGRALPKRRNHPIAVAAIRRLQRQAPDEVQSHFGIEADGSFLLDSVWFAARKR